MQFIKKGKTERKQIKSCQKGQNGEKNMPKIDNLILTGYMGTGKSTIGRMAAESFGCRFIDTDEAIEEEQKKTVNEIFASYGEEYFRKLETELIKRLCELPKGFVAATGGGLPIRQENAEILHRLGKVVYLRTSKETIVERLMGDTKRPLLKDASDKKALEEKVERMLEARGPVYESTADIILDTDGRQCDELVKVLGCIRNGGEAGQI